MGEQNVVQYVGVGIFAISMLTAFIGNHKGSPCRAERVTNQSLWDALFMLGVVGAFIGAGIAAL